MISDPIVEEIHRNRQKHAEKYDYDLKRIVEALREKELVSKHKQLSPGPKLLLDQKAS